MSQTQLSDWEQQQAVNARHRALIMQILRAHPEGLTTQQVVAAEAEVYGYTFLTDNRLREAKKLGWVTCTDDKPKKWKIVFKKCGGEEATA